MKRWEQHEQIKQILPSRSADGNDAIWPSSTWDPTSGSHLPPLFECRFKRLQSTYKLIMNAFPRLCPCSCLPIADGSSEGADEQSFSVDGVGNLPPDDQLRLPDDARDLLPGV